MPRPTTHKLLRAPLNHRNHCQPTDLRVDAALPPADAIMGVAFFSEVAPVDFGAFDRACLSLFRLTSGETWVRPHTHVPCPPA